MSKICRTCLQKTNQTFKTTQSLGCFGEGPVRISAVLRYCIPELYLGLSSNPELCFSCKEDLRISYIFKKKCLKTENILGDFLKSSRTTGKSIDLHDVLAKIEEKSKTDTPTTSQDVAVPSTTVNLNSVMLNLNKDKEETIRFDKPFSNEITKEGDSDSLDIRQSAPNPRNKGSFISISKHPNLIFHRKLITTSGLVDEFKSVSKEMESSKTVLKVIGDKSQFLKDVPQDLKGFCKISHVYSVNSNQVIANNSNLDNTSSVNNEARIEEDIVEIKEEPLDDLNGQESFNPAAMDEETLSASETASYEDLSSSNVDVQNLIDKIANIEHPDQYIDIPDFVTINNVGFKEFEEYKHMEIDESGVVQLQVEPKPSKEISGPTPIPLPVVAPPVAAPLGIVPPASSDSSNTDQTGTVVVDEMKEELKMLKVLSDMPDVLFVDGKRMVKCGNGYVEELKPSHLNFVDAFSKLNQKPRLGEQQVKKPTPRKRVRKKIKLVPVSEPLNKKLKFDTDECEKKDIVVLFTRYTTSGVYINDHDYLINPYKRNKILVEENSQWMCMCYLCNKKHPVNEHAEHMKDHGNSCLICRVDFGTPYLHNIHFRGHKKPCHLCAEIIPCYQIKEHEKKHSDAEHQNLYPGKKNRKRSKKGDDKSAYCQVVPKPDDVEILPTPDNMDAVKRASQAERKRRHLTGGNRKRRYTRRRVEEEIVKPVVEPKVLRSRINSNIRKLYAESDEKDCVQARTDESSSSKE